MAYRIRVLQHPDGSLTIIHPAMNDRARPPGLDDDTWAQQCLDKTMAKHPEWQALTARDMLDTALPASREKRAGWRLSGSAIVEDDAAHQAAMWTRKKAAPVASDDLLEWAVEQINVLRATFVPPLPAIELADARDGVIQRKLRKGK